MFNYVCGLTAAFVLRNSAHGNSDKHKSIVDESSAKTGAFISTGLLSC